MGTASRKIVLGLSLLAITAKDGQAQSKPSIPNKQPPKLKPPRSANKFNYQPTSQQSFTSQIQQAFLLIDEAKTPTEAKVLYSALMRLSLLHQALLQSYTKPTGPAYYATQAYDKSGQAAYARLEQLQGKRSTAQATRQIRILSVEARKMAQMADTAMGRH